jgi:hypothetical protein
LPRPADQPRRILVAYETTNEFVLTFLLLAIETEDKRRLSTAKLLHLRAVGHTEDGGLRENIAYVGVAGNDDQSAEFRNWPECSKERENDAQRPQPETP